MISWLVLPGLLRWLVCSYSWMLWPLHFGSCLWPIGRRRRRRQMMNPYSTGVLMPFAARWHSASSAACVSRSYHRVDVFLWLFVAIVAMHPSPLIWEADLDARRALRIFLDVIMVLYCPIIGYVHDDNVVRIVLLLSQRELGCCPSEADPKNSRPAAVLLIWYQSLLHTFVVIVSVFSVRSWYVYVIIQITRT